MNTQLTPTSSNEEFIRQLNMATGMTGSKPFPKHIKFNGSEGVFKVETEEKDIEGKPVYKTIGETLKIHIVRSRKMMQSNFDSEEKLYSKEFDGGIFQIFNQNKEVVFNGNYGQLKETNLYDDLKYQEVLYIFAGTNEPQLYRLKLSGSKLTNWFIYKNQFQNDNPARFWTFISKGVQDTKGAVKYYNLNFRKDAEIDQPTVIKRVSEVMQYINTYEATQSPVSVPKPQRSNYTTPALNTPVRQPQQAINAPQKPIGNAILPQGYQEMYGTDPDDVMPDFANNEEIQTENIPF